MKTPPARVPHILIMDDAPEILDVMRELLEEERYRVTVSRTLLDAESIKALAPDTIIQDFLFSSPLEQGLAALQAARHDPDLSRIPHVLCTAVSQVVTDDALAATIDSLDVQVVLKPFDLDTLVDVLATTLEHAPPTSQNQIGGAFSTVAM